MPLPYSKSYMLNDSGRLVANVLNLPRYTTINRAALIDNIFYLDGVFNLGLPARELDRLYDPNVETSRIRSTYKKLLEAVNENREPQKKLANIKYPKKGDPGREVAMNLTWNEARKELNRIDNTANYKIANVAVVQVTFPEAWATLADDIPADFKPMKGTSYYARNFAIGSFRVRPTPTLESPNGDMFATIELMDEIDGYYDITILETELARSVVHHSNDPESFFMLARYPDGTNNPPYALMAKLEIYSVPFNPYNPLNRPANEDQILIHQHLTYDIRKITTLSNSMGCGYNLIIAAYETGFNNQFKKNKLTAEFIHSIVKDNVPFQPENLSMDIDSMAKFFDKYRLSLTVYDSVNNILFERIFPETKAEAELKYPNDPRTINKHAMGPQHMHVMLSNNHFFVINERVRHLNNKAKDVKDRISSISTKCYLPSVKSLHPDMPRDWTIANTVEEIAAKFDGLFIERVGDSPIDHCIAYYGSYPSLLKWLYNEHKMTPMISHDKQRMINGVYISGIGKNKITIITPSSAFKFENAKDITPFQQANFDFSNEIRKKIYLSTYEKSTADVFNQIKRGGFVSGMEYNDRKVPNIPYDIRRQYAGIIAEIEAVPVASVFCRWEKITDMSLPISATCFYIIEAKVGHAVNCYISNRYSIVYGDNYMQFIRTQPEKARDNYKAVFKYTPHTKMPSGGFKAALARLWANENIADQLKKNIPNIEIGLLGKKVNRIHESYLFHDRDEAINTCRMMNEVSAELGNVGDDLFDISPDVYQIQNVNEFGDMSSGSGGNINPNFNSTGMYVITAGATRTMTNGFALLHNMILDKSRYQLYSLNNALKVIGEVPFSYRVDCVYTRCPEHLNTVALRHEYQNGIATQINKMWNIENGKPGSCKLETLKDMNCIKYNGCEIKTEIKQDEEDSEFIEGIEEVKPVVKNIDITGGRSPPSPPGSDGGPCPRDEYKITADVIPNYTLVLAKYPGCGKSFTCIKTHYEMESKPKILILCSWNNLRFEIMNFIRNANDFSDRVNVLTFDKCFGFSDDSRETDVADIKKKSLTHYVDGVQVLIIDEYFLLSESRRCMIKTIKDRCPNLKIIANGDIDQLDAIESTPHAHNNFTAEERRAYIQRTTDELFPNRITLNIIKRCDPESAKQMMGLIDDLRDENKPLFDTMRKYLKKEQFVTDMPIVKERCTINITNYKQSRDAVNKLVYQCPSPFSNMVAGNDYMCIKSNPDVGIYTNVIYRYLGETPADNKRIKNTHRIINTIENKIIMINKTLLAASFIAPHARTCHSAQGTTISTPYTIFDMHEDVSRNWAIVALTRTKDISHLNVWVGPSMYRFNLDKNIESKIEGHIAADKAKGMLDVPNDYVNIGWASRMLRQTKTCKSISGQGCGKPINAENFSINRINNAMYHTKDNCEIICRHCNASMSDNC